MLPACLFPSPPLPFPEGEGRFLQVADNPFLKVLHLYAPNFESRAGCHDKPSLSIENGYFSFLLAAFLEPCRCCQVAERASALFTRTRVDQQLTLHHHTPGYRENETDGLAGSRSENYSSLRESRMGCLPGSSRDSDQDECLSRGSTDQREIRRADRERVRFLLGIAALMGESPIGRP